MSECTPYSINVPQAQLDELRSRLQRSQWPDVLDAADWTFGPSRHYIQGLVDDLQTRYDWRSHEARINRLPQFTTEVDGQRLHFLHLRTSHRPSNPLLLVHGWPGSFVEFLEIAPLLAEAGTTSAGTVAFDLVIPSLPGNRCIQHPSVL